MDPNNQRVRNSNVNLTDSSANPFNDAMEVSVGIDISNVNLTRHSVGIPTTKNKNVSGIKRKINTRNRMALRSRSRNRHGLS